MNPVYLSGVCVVCVCEDNSSSVSTYSNVENESREARLEDVKLRRMTAGDWAEPIGPSFCLGNCVGLCFKYIYIYSQLLDGNLVVSTHSAVLNSKFICRRTRRFSPLSVYLSFSSLSYIFIFKKRKTLFNQYRRPLGFLFLPYKSISRMFNCLVYIIKVLSTSRFLQ